MPYSKYNLYYKNKTRKPRMTEYRSKPNNRRQKTHSYKLISYNNLNDSMAKFDDHSMDFASQSILIQNLTNNEPIAQTTSGPIAQTHQDDHELNEINYITNDISNDDSELNEDLICQTLVSLSYATNMTHSALSLVAELTQLVTNSNNMPKKFRDLITRVSKDQVDYTKIWFCQTCNVQIVLNKPSQRECEYCNKR
jgi:rubrerythrin